MAPIRASVGLLLWVLPLWSQAWLPAKGEGYVSLGVQTLWVGHHLTSFGTRAGSTDNIRSNVISMGLTYGVTDRFAVATVLPYLATRYSGTTPHGGDDGLPTRLDDGNYHGTFQDFRIDTHYNVLRDPVVLTPLFSVVLPSHHYDTFGHAAPGRDLREYQVGFNLGRQLRPWLPRAYLDLRYAYAFAQSIADIDTDRSNVDLEVGYFLRPNLILRGFGAWQKTHGGVENSPNFNLPPHQYHLHDRVWRAHYMRLGAGVAFPLTRSLDLYTGFMTTTSGKNAETTRGFGVGVSWRFSRQPSQEVTLPAQSGDPSPQQP